MGVGILRDFKVDFAVYLFDVEGMGGKFGIELGAVVAERMEACDHVIQQCFMETFVLLCSRYHDALLSRDMYKL